MKVTIFALALWALAAPGAAKPLCAVVAASANAPYFAPEEGVLLQSEPNFPSTASVSRLGQGNVGTVYRVSEGTELSVVKIYRDFRRGWDKETFSWREQVPAKTFQQTDLALFEVFHREAARGFHIPSVTPVTINGSPALRFGENLYGKSVFHLLSDPKLEPALRERVETLYRERLEEFAEFLRREFKAGGGVLVESDATSAHRFPYLEMSIEYTHGQTRTSTRIHIASDGILVDAYTLQMWLVDPN